MIKKEKSEIDIVAIIFFVAAIAICIILYKEFNKEVLTKEEIELQKQGYIKTALTEEELASSNYQECIEYNNTFYCY